MSATPDATFAGIVERRYSRRGVLRLSLQAIMASVFTGSSWHLYAGDAGPPAHAALPDFKAVPLSTADTVVVPPGYTARPFLPWGTPICGEYPAYQADGENHALEQEQQIGSHHDGMHFFPLAGGAEGNRRGLLCINHEYVDLHKLHPEGASFSNGARTNPDEVYKELAAHGVSVVEISEIEHGNWAVVRGRYNRRITGMTPMELTGPARGSPFLRTRYSPDGTRTRGTLSNCSHGVTPWGTYLTCEENWSGCFINHGTLPREHARYGIRTTRTYNGWETLHEIDEFARFDATAHGMNAGDDYRNEPNTQGWIVEIDPFDPTSTPKKRTALGRFAHEGAVIAPVRDGEPVTVYSGDDSANEYIYKFVSRSLYRQDQDNRNLLEHGTLYVAVFHEDGRGEWRPLDSDNEAFRAAAKAADVPFQDQADILVNTRLAADVMGATRLDRPEWGAVHPQSREVYFTLTGNTGRGTAHPVDAANPRARNTYGHIIRWREQDHCPWALQFQWDLFLFAGPDGQILPSESGAELTDANRFGCPDGLWFDDNGLLWIQTDLNSNRQRLDRNLLGNNQMLVANPQTGEIRRFLTGPRGQEVTGITCTPDHRTLFVNIQHPGEDSEHHPELASHWPDGGTARPRSATVIITRDDGGIIGT